ncbi:MAG: DUF371 domain-containing protein [Candidatus Altiarchaeales archaeon]|nr:MAG: DUF371 domain-containing protein [Candidatus Altiarchaeales archaeon]HDI72798.1 DUF371 domain-containing protein [Candidatus Altiarchaeales archaeon]
MLIEKIKAKGHENITARHRTTIEITREKHLTQRGDCIIAVSADRGMPDLSNEFKERLRNENTKLKIKLTCSDSEEILIAYGHPNLTFKNPDEMVIRKSNFICDRTLAIKADKASYDLNRKFVEKLKKCNDVEIELIIKS